MAEGAGNEEMTAQLFANFTSQRVVKPFVKPSLDSPQTKFGVNALITLKEARKISQKPGSQADLFRRNVLVAGACGPLSANPVRLSVVFNVQYI